ncbi:endopeptidase La [Thermoflexibacter ruber]|uniref:Lon protease n=1 Tax=Thermoflexibacter ruber TaxID=1003 RepID=A0A1I2B5W5_9BACT|nr:endopeptidase La [Thermoflexibacter ruber]SFE51466.1 ATP-dependent Lon protease [Thermoflexibacter ruber]
MAKQFNNIFLLWGGANILGGSDSEEFIPIISTDEEDIKDAKYPEDLAILPIRNTVLFPSMVLPITVGRQKSIRLVKKAYKGDRLIGVVAQRNSAADEPTLDDLYSVGTLARILKLIILPDGNTTIIIQGLKKIEIAHLIKDTPYLTAKVKFPVDAPLDTSKRETKALTQSLKETAQKIIRLNPEIPQEAQIALENIESINFLIHFLCSNINAELKDKQELLEFDNIKDRATKLLEHMWRDIQLLEIKKEIHSKTHSDIDQQQRDYFLRQQIKVLQDELGDDSAEQEIENLKARASKKQWSEAVAKHFQKEVDRLARMNPAAAEYPMALGYLEFLLDLPWQEFTKDHFDLKNAKKILDKDHYGLKKVKERILEYLAVLKLKNDMKGPILCFYGPPGVGKTSLGKSIAESLKRKYVRMSLGGLHDEAEIRGHRKTYVGAMPGRILQNIKRAGSSNPVFILDEIDKVGSDFRGDPSSALLEVLDPEQNHSFMDNYLEVDYDLSKVLFIATANSLDTIHPALRDRMEIIEINGYTQEEKLEIAKKHLLPKLRKEHGLTSKDFTIDNKAILKVISEYTHESGVRNLEQKLAAVVRNIAKSVAMAEDYSKIVKETDIERILGAPIFDKEMYQDNSVAGVATGLAWTQSGGEILFIESSLSKGRGTFTLSGQLGEVMRESAMAALSYLKAHAEELGIDYRIFSHYDLHIHVPAGAVPKDGPSAGITMFTSLASVYTQQKIKEKLAMTGEITLRGKVLPVGGIKEKVLAARRAGIEEIILSVKNKKDIDEIEKEYIKDLKFHFVETIQEVLDLALTKEKVKKPLIFKIEENNPSTSQN